MCTNRRAPFRSLLLIITESDIRNYNYVESSNVCQLLAGVYAVRRFSKTKRMDVQNTVSQSMRGSDQFAWTDGCCKQLTRICTSSIVKTVEHTHTHTHTHVNTHVRRATHSHTYLHTHVLHRIIPFHKSKNCT